MFRLLLAFSLWSGVFGKGQNINGAVDQLLELGRQTLASAGQDKIPLPDLEKGFEKKIFGATIRGQFVAENGFLRDVTTIRRTGDVEIENVGDSLVITAALGMDLAVDYGHYKLELTPILSEGSIHAASTRNSLSAVIIITHDDDKCKVELESANIDDLGDFDVKLTGPGNINKFGSVLIPWILNQFQTLVRLKIADGVERIFKEALKDNNICDEIVNLMIERR